MVMMIDIRSIDWNEAWKKNDPATKSGKGFISCGRRWADPDRCKKFDEMVSFNNWSGAQSRINDMKITPESRVLDIGAGPGSLSIPLSRIAKEVTAVEPSKAMFSCLYDHIKSEHINNITVVERAWEDVVVSRDLTPPYDVVVASYSLGFPDLKDALLKMDEVSSQYVYIFWFADMQSPWQRNYGEIWENLYGEPRAGGKKPNIIFNLLNQMGIYANVQVTKEESVVRFPSLDEAVSDQSSGLNLETDEQREVLRTYLAGKLQKEDGGYVMRHPSYRATIWWKKEENRSP